MLNERQNEILSILIKEKRVSVNDLITRLYVSKPTMRRDLAELEKLGYLRRIHGGAILTNADDDLAQVPFSRRALEEASAKEIMGHKAAELVKDYDTIMLDSSTSAFAIIPYLKNKTGIHVITNGINCLSTLAELEIPTISTGGKLMAHSFSLIGDGAHDSIVQYNADIAFVSCRGLSLNGNATDPAVDEIAIRKAMLYHAKTKVLLCYIKRVGKEYMQNICNVKDIDYLVSDKPMPKEINELVTVL